MSSLGGSPSGLPPPQKILAGKSCFLLPNLNSSSFPQSFRDAPIFLSPWKKSTHTAYFPPCLHILFRQDFAAVEGDERMRFIVLGILCAAAVVVTLACLWINR